MKIVVGIKEANRIVLGQCANVRPINHFQLCDFLIGNTFDRPFHSETLKLDSYFLDLQQTMDETGSPLAGEMSGHMFIANEYFGCDDGIYAGVRLLRLLSESGKSLAELRSALPMVHNTPEILRRCAQVQNHRRYKQALGRARVKSQPEFIQLTLGK